MLFLRVDYLEKKIWNMEINLERGDLLQLDPITHKGTVKLLAPGKKHKVCQLYVFSLLSLFLNNGL